MDEYVIAVEDHDQTLYLRVRSAPEDLWTEDFHRATPFGSASAADSYMRKAVNPDIGKQTIVTPKGLDWSVHKRVISTEKVEPTKVYYIRHAERKIGSTEIPAGEWAWVEYHDWALSQGWPDLEHKWEDRY